MNTEELKLILETVRSIADTAGMAGIIWVCIHYLVVLLQALVWPVALAVVAAIVGKTIVDAWQSKIKQKTLPDGNALEATKQAQLRLEQAKEETAKKKVESEKDTAAQQLTLIAMTAGAEFTPYSGIYRSEQFRSILEKVRK